MSVPVSKDSGEGNSGKRESGADDGGGSADRGGRGLRRVWRGGAPAADSRQRGVPQSPVLCTNLSGRPRLRLVRSVPQLNTCQLTGQDKDRTSNSP